MKKIAIVSLIFVGGLLAITCNNSDFLSQWAQASDGEQGGKPEMVAAVQQKTAAPQAAVKASSEAAALEIKRQQLAERESALAAKEQELKALSESLDARVRELDVARKGIDEAYARIQAVQKKMQEERFQKMLKLFKTLKADETAKVMNKLEEGEAIMVLDQLPLKVTAKLVPLITQPRVVKWARENLKVE